MWSNFSAKKVSENIVRVQSYKIMHSYHKRLRVPIKGEV